MERQDHPLIGKDIGEISGFGATGITIAGDLKDCISKGDVVIDFTQHEASMVHLGTASDYGKAIVIGSTGFSPEETGRIKKMAERVRCVVAPNMSVGVNVMFKILGDLAAILGDDFDVEIIEAHHNQKKDAPSGTAVRMAEVLATALKRNLDRVGVYGRKGMIGARTREENRYLNR